MALSGSIGGSFSGYTSDKVRPYIDWSGSQSIAGNYTDVTVWVYFQKLNSAYWGYNLTGSANCNININGDNSNSSITFDLRDPNTLNMVRSRTVRVNHNSDGSKSCYIGADGNTQVGYGTYNFGTLVTLDTIPREAYVTNAVSFTVGNNIPLTINNAGNMYVRAALYVNSTLIKTQDLGQVTSSTLTLDGTNNANIYAQMPNDTSKAMFVRITTYQNSNYTGQIGGNRDKAGTASIDQNANKPTFSTYALSNVDKNVVVTDKYGNTLVTSSTATLLGSSTRIIKGYSKVRARVTSANKMVALNSATAVKYRLVAGSQQVEQNYHASNDVDLELDNVDVNAFTVSAFDSRNLSTAVAGSLSLMAEFEPLTLFNINLLRDNNIDTLTKLSFEGLIWKKYFGSNGASAVGVLNALTAAYRWKRSNHAWGALDGTFTITIASPGVVTKSSHGLETGDQVWFTTTGALPTGLAINTVYYVIYVSSSTFKLATSKANALAGTAINTSGSQSGVHTLNADSQWATITPSVDSSGNITFDSYINGDLGASGFDTDRSFDIEVRGFDKLSQVIIEDTLSVGTPLMHYTKEGIAIKDRYDETEGGDFQVGGLDIFSYIIPTGGIIPYGGLKPPSKFLICDGSAVSRTTYARLFEAIVPNLGNPSITIASPGVATIANHGLLTGDAVYLTTTGALPTGLSQNTLYYAIRVDANTFRFASSRANAIASTAINTTGSQSGTHTVRYCPWGLGNGSSTFNLPALAGRTPVGVDNSQTEFKAAGTSGGAKTHTLSTSEIPSHAHQQRADQSGDPGVNLPGSGLTYQPGLANNNGGGRNGSNTHNTGGGGSHNNLQPYLSINFIIRI